MNETARRLGPAVALAGLAGTTALGFFAAERGTEWVLSPREGSPERVAACADAIVELTGDRITGIHEVADVPAACSTFTYTFDSTETVTTSKVNGSYSSTYNTVYDLPPAEDFVEARSAVDEERVAYWARRVGYIGSGAGFLVGLGVFVVPPVNRRYEANNGIMV